jgi:hypothetical protein
LISFQRRRSSSASWLWLARGLLRADMLGDVASQWA